MLRLAACFVVLAFFVCAVGAADVEELDVTPNTLHSYLRHNPVDLEDGDHVHNFGDGFYIKESHVNHLADHVGQHLKHAANHLTELAKHAVNTGFGSKEWIQNEMERYHNEEGSAYEMKKRARQYLESKGRTNQDREDLWKKAGADNFYNDLANKDMADAYAKAEVIHDPEREEGWAEAKKEWDDWMAKPENKKLVYTDTPWADEEDDAEVELGESGIDLDDIAPNPREWKMAPHQGKVNFHMDHSAVAAPKQPTQALSTPIAGHGDVVKKLRRAGYNEQQLQMMADMLSVAKSSTGKDLLGESMGTQETKGSCSPGQCAKVLRDHIIDTTAELAKLTGRPVPPAPAGTSLWDASSHGGKGAPQELPAPKGGGKAYQAPPPKKATGAAAKELKKEAEENAKEPSFSIGGETKEETTNDPQPITADDVRGQMTVGNGMGSNTDAGDVADKPAETAEEPPEKHIPPPAPEEMPPGCPLSKKRDTCDKMKFMGPFACWSMGQGEHSMPGEGAGADFRVIMRDNDFYPHSKKLGYLDLADFRWRFTAGKCMWWNQLFRSMNEPTWLMDASKDYGNAKAEGGFKVMWMCMIYAMAMSRHWTAQNDGAFWPIMVVKGMMQEFGLDKKGPVKSARAELVSGLKHLNGDIIGSVWTYLYEFGMSPCLNYVIMFQMILEALIGMASLSSSCKCGTAETPPCVSATCPQYLKKPACLYNPKTTLGVSYIKPPVPVWNCFVSGAQEAEDCERNKVTGKCMRISMASPIGLLASGAIAPLAMFKPAAQAAQKMLEMMSNPLDTFRLHFNNFFEFKFALSDPLDVIWIHGGDVIGLLEILFMIPIPPIQALFEGLIGGLKLPSIVGIINKALGFIVKVVFENPISKMILNGPTKICSMVLSAFVNNPIAKGLIKMFKAFVKLLDKPIKFSLFGKRFCFTVLGILKKVEAMFKMILDKVMKMVSAILGPIFKLIDKGLSKIASLVKIPSIPGFGGMMGKSGNIWTMLKETGAFDNPFTAFAACSWNLPWAQESGQNLCNCCLMGWAVSQPVNPGWEWSPLQEKMVHAKKQATCTKYGQDPNKCIVTDVDKSVPSLAAVFMPPCAKTPLGKLTMVGKMQYEAHQCIDKKVKLNTMLKVGLVWVFKGFMCRFLNIGLNPKVMMQLSPLPPVALFRRRRAGKKSTTPGMDLCKEYLKGKSGKKKKGWRV